MVIDTVKKIFFHRATKIIGGIVVGIFLALLLIGSLAPKEFSGSVVHTFDAPKEVIWNILTDIEGLPTRRREIVSVERLSASESGRPRWKENTNMSGYILFEATEEKLHQRLVYTMLESSFGMSGVWSYEFEPKGDTVTLTISEKSQIDAVLVRAVMTLSGRDANLQREVELIQNTINQ